MMNAFNLAVCEVSLLRCTMPLERVWQQTAKEIVNYASGRNVTGKRSGDETKQKKTNRKHTHIEKIHLHIIYEP